MPVSHSREELIAQINSLSERALADGVLLDLPRARRLDQGANPQKQLRLALDGDLKKRFAAQIERYLEWYGNKGLAWDVIIKRLEAPFEEEP